MTWASGITEWIENDTAYISVVFSWKMQAAFQRAAWHKANGLKVRVGGGGAFYFQHYLDGVAEYGGRVDALVRHNPEATKASEGCPVGCSFCTVPNIEGKTFKFIPEFTPRPVIIDNNLSALPFDYQEFIVQKYIDHGIFIKDANSGFEPRTFTEDTFHLWKKINKGAWRFGFDEESEENYCENMANILQGVRGPLKRVYVLIGNEPIESCYRRILKVIEWGCEPHVQPVMALNTLEKKPMIKFDWTEKKLKGLTRWANRWIWRTVKFEDYKYNGG